MLRIRGLALAAGGDRIGARAALTEALDVAVAWRHPRRTVDALQALLDTTDPASDPEQVEAWQVGLDELADRLGLA